MTLTTENVFNVQISGDHHKHDAIQSLAFIKANHLGFAEGRVVKYLLRHKQKGGVENLKKAKHYIDLMITTQYGSNE